MPRFLFIWSKHRLLNLIKPYKYTQLLILLIFIMQKINQNQQFNRFCTALMQNRFLFSFFSMRYFIGKKYIGSIQENKENRRLFNYLFCILFEINLYQELFQEHFEMYRSPQQRFQRTATLYCGKNAPEENPPAPRCGSPKHYKLTEQYPNQFDLKGKSKLFQEEKIEPKQKVEDKIINLQKMLELEKSKRQTEFSELFKMINSLRQRKKNSEQTDDPSFNYIQQVQPMTPRVRTKQNQFTKSPRQQNYQTYTPAYETITKPKQSRYKNSHREDDSFFQRSLEDFSFKSLQLLLTKIERESQFNNRNVVRIQEEMMAMRGVIANFKTKTGIPIEVEKYVRDSYLTIKNQMETQRNSLKFSLIDIIQQKIKQKLGDNKFSTLLKKQQELERKLSQNQNKIQNMQNTNQFLGAQMKALDQKLSSQITNINEVMQQKFAYFSEKTMSMNKDLEKTTKNQHDKIQYLMKEIECQKIRVQEIEETNLQFFESLEQTIQNIQEKFQLIKNQQIPQKQTSEIFNAEIFEAKLQQKSQQNFDKLRRQFQETLKILSLELNAKIKKIEQKMQSIDSYLIKTPKLTKYNSLNQPHHEYLSQSESSNFLKKNEMVNKIIDKELQEAAQLYRKDSENSCEEHQKIMELISENCSFLESRNCTIQESVADVIAVLNNIVEKLRYVM